MAVHTAPLPRLRQDVWHGRFGPVLALALVTLPFAAALVWAVSARPLDEASIAGEIRATATLVDDHAAAMIRVGERVSAAASASTAPDRVAWVAYGAHMVADGRGLEALGDRLRQTAIVAEADPLHRGRVDVAAAVLQARWQQLRADGSATAEHGRVMVQMAREQRAGAASPFITAADLGEIERASVGMEEAGERIVRAADMLLASTGQVQRWMGIGR